MLKAARMALVSPVEPRRLQGTRERTVADVESRLQPGLPRIPGELIRGFLVPEATGSHDKRRPPWTDYKILFS